MDAQLRRRYSKWIVFVLFFLAVIVLLIGLIGGLTLEKFLLAVLVPLIPAFVFGLRQYTEHNEAAVRLDRLRENAEALVQEIINKRYTPQDLERESYSLQTQIFDNRRRSPLILDWLYSRLRHEDEEKMNKGAESLVQELIQNP
ncbi:S-4TM family putative pore-forming effector [Sodalinema gerasimenkoae]|uniref:S-4TM family putative pore-forming effector n=1 Tax=Sodalinema gerasimenkoae TaxID=2862348 RepID=UPI0031B5DB81